MNMLLDLADKLWPDIDGVAIADLNAPIDFCPPEGCGYAKPCKTWSDPYGCGGCCYCRGCELAYWNGVSAPQLWEGDNA